MIRFLRLLWDKHQFNARMAELDARDRLARLTGSTHRIHTVRTTKREFIHAQLRKELGQ